MCSFLNKDWSAFPQMVYASARLLACMILLDTDSGRSIVVNCIEVYSRHRAIDTVNHSKYEKVWFQQRLFHQ
ncbi:hypothetical protein BDF20DRAFT_599373 [Mycotypha africana]|uniref:uncharacterized protein n=1 Tax=Mycotypha africana TaxID=64632 RepID=UPI002300F1D4|nr:uncharacterized protein BDF20DRAFT_599373 [Mycotypha africana]KAI8975318.1 hypothetical protein BDF20DRAFT_599373 [Mycotypha africana]